MDRVIHVVDIPDIYIDYSKQRIHTGTQNIRHKQIDLLKDCIHIQAYMQYRHIRLDVVAQYSLKEI